MKRYIYLLAIAGLSACGTEEKGAASQSADDAPKVSEGQQLFINNCVQCHNVKTDKIGPKLEGVAARWNNDTAKLYAFIKNAPEVIKAGDPRAMKVYDEWNQTMMTPMPHLTNGEIDKIMEYINKGEQ